MPCTTEREVFPSNAGCIIADGYKAVIPTKKRYLGGRSALAERTTIQATLATVNETEIANFADWWVNDLNYGTIPFWLDIKFFGVMQRLEVMFTDGIDEVIKDGNSYTSIRLQILNEEGLSLEPPVVIPDPIQLSVKWDTMTADSEVLIEGAVGTSMEYTNDGGTTWSTIPIGTDNTLVMSTGPYEIKETIANTVTRCAFIDILGSYSITGDVVAEGGALTSGHKMFSNMKYVDNIDISKLHKSLILDTTAMFYNCSLITDINTLGFDNVTMSNNMFYGCVALITCDLTDFPSIVNAEGMFYDCRVLNNVDSTACTSLVTSPRMFYNCYALTNINTAGFTSVADTYLMFYYNKFMVTIDCTPFVSVTNSDGMFFNCHSLTSIITDVNTFKLSTNTNDMFRYCALLNNVNGSIYTSSITADFMFEGCFALSVIDTTGFTAVENAQGMFASCTSLTAIDESNFTSVIGAQSMFAYAGIITFDASAFSNTTNTYRMFYLAPNFTHFNNGHTLTLVTVAREMFRDCLVLEYVDSSGFISVTGGERMFSGCINLNVFDATPMVSIEEALGMFQNTGISTIDASGFGHIDDAASMFYGCDNLVTVSNPTFTKVRFATAMFANCLSLPNLDTASFTSVSNPSQMFEGCSELEYITTFNSLSNTFVEMFKDCVKLKCISAINTTGSTNAHPAMFQNCVLLEQPDATAIIDIESIAGLDWTNVLPCP